MSATLDDLIAAMLPNVLFDGWSQKSLDAAAAELGLTADELAALAPGGAGDVLDAFSGWADRQMMAALAAADLTDLRLGQRVALALKSRFRALAPHREAVRRALSARVSPQGAVAAARAAAATADTIWYEVGDQATDFSFHTKRATLGAIHTAAMLYWLDDESPESRDTEDFIDRALAGLKNIPSLSAGLQGLVKPFTAPFDMMRAGRRN